MATTGEIAGVEQWPTRERFTEARQALAAAYNALESLTSEYRALNNEYDPSDIAEESSPVPAESVAAVVEFVTETEFGVAGIEELHKEIVGWPGLLAHVRLEQGVTSSTERGTA